MNRFWSKVTLSDNCWLWSAATNNTGYGYFRFQNKLQLAHRVSYILSKSEIPLGMSVRHKCDVGLCVRPSHLEIGTQQDNMDDMRIRCRERKAIGSCNGNSALFKWQIPVIRKMIASNLWSQVSIGQLFNVGPTNISSIKLGKTWRHV